MKLVKVHCLGGVGTVTGSCFLLETIGGSKCLVDCGMFQGPRHIEELNNLPWGFDPSTVERLFLTHAHIDHSGRIPKLVKDGFKGRIIASEPTLDLCEIMLFDSAHLQEMDALWKTKKNKRQGKGPAEPLYTQEDVSKSIRLFEPSKKDQIISFGDGCKARLRTAGHILGASILEIWFGKGPEERLKIVFSGDLGRRDQLLIEDPSEIFDTDYLFVESTYGNRDHKGFEESKEELLQAIQYAVSNGEKVLIPAFAVERTQELLFILAEFKRQRLIPDMPVYLDSPLAIKATEIFRKHRAFYDKETMALVEKGIDPLSMPGLHFTLSTKESMEINERPGPAIVIAGNGMCTGGRIRHHLKHNLWKKGASLVIVGYQAKGTTGREIVDGAKYVRIFGEKVAVAAKVFTIGGFSAHAGQKEILEWIGHFESKPIVYITHGEPEASESLKAKIEEIFGLRVHIPKLRERLVLMPKLKGPEIEVVEERPKDSKAILYNILVDMEKEIKRLKTMVQSSDPSKEIPVEELDRYNYLLEELKEMGS